MYRAANRSVRMSSSSCYRFFIILFIVFGVTTTTLSAKDRDRILIISSGSDEIISLDGFIDVLALQDRSLSFEEILLSSGSFKEITTHDINLGFVRTTAWLRFAVALAPNAVNSQSMVLTLKPNFTDELSVFVAPYAEELQAKDFDVMELGDHTRTNRENISTATNAVRLNLKPGLPLVIYVRARNWDASLNVSAQILSQRAYDEGALYRNLVIGMWFGGMVTIALIQFIFLYFERKRIYTFVICNIACVTLTYFGSLGLARLIFFSEGGLGNDLVTNAPPWAGLAAGSMTIIAVLELERRYPRLSQFLKGAALVGLIGVVCALLGITRYYVLFAVPVVFAVTTTAMIIAVRDFQAEPGAERALNLGAFGLLWTGLAATALQRHGILALPTWVAESYASTSILHFILLTGALAVRLRNAEISAKTAHDLALASAHAAESHANALVKERTRELSEAKALAEAALRAELVAKQQQVQFMEIISHQYRTPLSIIKTNLESIGHTLPKDDVANLHRLKLARLGVSRLVDVLEINLTRSKVQGTTYVPEFDVVSVIDVIEHAASHASDLLHGITLHVDVSSAARVALLRIDRDLMHLAILNLLENAFKFSLPVGSTHVWLVADCDEVRVSLRIADSGIGLGGEVLCDLISHGARGRNAEHITGTGVGLSIVKRTADVHGGIFELNSLAPVGAEAVIRLPRYFGGLPNLASQSPPH